MISIEIARELKEAGLKWEPKKNDTYWNVDGKKVVTVRRPSRMIYSWYYVWLPSLGQLLAEIEARGYTWKASRYDTGQYLFKIFEIDESSINFCYGICKDTFEEAAGCGLLWTLRGERDG